MRPESDNPYPSKEGAYERCYDLLELVRAIVVRLVAPVVGLVGIGYEELQGHVDPELLVLYMALLGYGGYKNIKAKGGPGGQGS